MTTTNLACLVPATLRNGESVDLLTSVIMHNADDTATVFVRIDGVTVEVNIEDVYDTDPQFRLPLYHRTESGRWHRWGS